MQSLTPQSQSIPQPEFNHSLNVWLLSILKEAAKSLLLSLLAGAALAYFLSKLFVKSYLSTIGFDGLIYDALINNDTVSAFTLAIFLIVFSYLFTFSFPGTVLRYVYHESVVLFQDFHDSHKNAIRGFMIAFLFIPPLVLLALAIFGVNVNWFFVPILVLPMLLFGWIVVSQTNFSTLTGHNKREQLKNAIKLIFFSSTNGKIIGIAVVFAGLLTVTFSPFYLMLQIIDNGNMSFGWLIGILLIFWFTYSVFYGIRIIERESIQYLVDIAFSLFLLVVTLGYSANTIKISIAEFAGIKDNSAKVYQILQKDFIELQKQMVLRWSIKQGSPTCTVQDSQKQACYVLSATNNLTNDRFLLAKVIFRDGKKSILCPPDFELDKKIEEDNTIASRMTQNPCFMINSELLTPTSLTDDLIEKRGLFELSNQLLVNKLFIRMPKIK